MSRAMVKRLRANEIFFIIPSFDSWVFRIKRIANLPLDIPASIDKEAPALLHCKEG